MHSTRIKLLSICFLLILNVIPIQSVILSLTFVMSAYAYAQQAYGVYEFIKGAVTEKDDKMLKFINEIKTTSEQISQTVDKVFIYLISKSLVYSFQDLLYR